MDRPPFGGPWELGGEANPGDIRPPLEKLFDLFADLYETFGALYGWTPRQVDECELWELGRIITKSNERHAQTPTEKTKSGSDTPKYQKKRNIVQERIAYEKGLGPKPEPDILTAEQLEPITKAVPGKEL